MNHPLTQPQRASLGLTTRMCLAAVLVALSAGHLRAQGVGGTRGLPSSSDGIHTIQGHVCGPDGSPVSTQLRVRLESTHTNSLMAVTDKDGAFSFARLQPGDYRVTVEGGSAFETAYENVQIHRGYSAGGRMAKLAIFLRPREKDDFQSVHKEAVELYKKAGESDRAGDSKKAVEHLIKALQIYPRFAPALNELGLQYLKLRQMDKAAQTFEELLKLKPADAHARLNLGIALFNLKKSDEAETHLREALKLNIPGPTAHYYLGVTLIRLKRYDEAQKELELAIANGGENLPQAHRYLGGLYMSARKNREAADELEKYLTLDAKAADAEVIRGTIKELRAKP